jgi:hypothetical protein
MPSLEQHCEECIHFLGDEFSYVHIWLDEFAIILGPRHRLSRHHKEGIEEVRGIWGDRAASAAERHIISDVGEVLSRSDLRKKWKKSHPYKRDMMDSSQPPVI